MTPTWAAVPGYEGSYEVSDAGQVRSLDRVINTTRGMRPQRGRLLSPAINATHGYRAVDLCLDGHKQTFLVHALVALAFLGPRPSGHYVLHSNGDQLDNRVENLRYGTQSENMHDSVKHGTHWSIRHNRSRQAGTPTASIDVP